MYNQLTNAIQNIYQSNKTKLPTVNMTIDDTVNMTNETVDIVGVHMKSNSEVEIIGSEEMVEAHQMLAQKSKI